MSEAARQYDVVGDILAVDRRAEIRVLTQIPGTYQLSSRHGDDGKRREFACRALDMSPRAMLLAAPVRGAIGERVIAYLDRFGRFDGRILRLYDRGFAMSILIDEAARALLTARLAWLLDHQNYDISDQRKHRRIVPREPYSTLIFADGRTLTSFVIDYSSSGAAVSADLMPQIGESLAIGCVVGRVCRQFESGFAVQFAELQDLQQLPHRLLRR